MLRPNQRNGDTDEWEEKGKSLDEALEDQGNDDDDNKDDTEEEDK